MSSELNEIQDALKNASWDELAQAQNFALLAPDVEPAKRMAVIALVANEVQLRQTEGLGRKAERFWNRHAQTIAAVAIGAAFG
jgi:hypothetical protein